MAYHSLRTHWCRTSNYFLQKLHIDIWTSMLILYVSQALLLNQQVLGGMMTCGALRNATALTLKVPQSENGAPDPSHKFCFPHPLNREKLSLENMRLQTSADQNGAENSDTDTTATAVTTTEHGIVFSLQGCQKHLTGSRHRHHGLKPYALVHRLKSDCLCQNYLLTETTELRLESTLWVINGILMKYRGHFCLHPGYRSLTLNKIRTYRIQGKVKVSGQEPCDGKHVPPLGVFNVWTKEAHPCGEEAYNEDIKAEGYPVCLMKPELKGSIPYRDACLPPNGIHFNEIPIHCGPLGAQVNAFLCGVACRKQGLIPIPGGCHMYGKCHLVQGEYVFYLVQCPKGHRFDRDLRRCVPGACMIKVKRNKKDSYVIH